MSKIIVEDRTVPPSIKSITCALRDHIFYNATKVGLASGLKSIEIASALFMASEDMANYFADLSLVSSDDILKLRQDAIEDSFKRFKDIKESGRLDVIKNAVSVLNNVKGVK